MLLSKDGRFVAEAWRHLDDADPAPEASAVTVSLPRWQRERPTLLGRAAPLGVRLPNDASPAALEGDLGRLDIILLFFPRFTDGRAYSQASLLRGRLGYRGEVRATGNVLRDQLLFMRRCGIDSFEVPDRALTENWGAALTEFDVFYQPASDGRPWRRHRAPQA